jgi:hypothetical protein
MTYPGVLEGVGVALESKYRTAFQDVEPAKANVASVTNTLATVRVHALRDQNGI